MNKGMPPRCRNPRGFGGCIVSAKPIDGQGDIEDAGSNFFVKATRSAVGGAHVEPGQWWKVAGERSRWILDVNSYQIIETQIEASSSVLLRPSDEHIISFMAGSPAFEGIGKVKARKLWEIFGELLYDHLDNGNVPELSKVLTPASADQVANADAIITMSRLCELIGLGPRLVLVGHPEQLMPVGPGLVLHALEKVTQVPVAQLTVVKRYGGAIANAAASIRKARWPEL